MLAEVDRFFYWDIVGVGIVRGAPTYSVDGEDVFRGQELAAAVLVTPCETRDRAQRQG